MSIVLDLIFSALTNCMPQVLGLKLDFITLCRINPFFFFFLLFHSQQKHIKQSLLETQSLLNIKIPFS
jgi:hypothetical protein